ncbi:glycosyltransferase [uncultured Desulfobacter sp.]|uniref:glycosyltransferase n=1 Tax=uncultured Desulfobacter sp. TaxID=240139 RepID=UPI002AAB3D60|nr:glycosyltransferase [uncultured Desulfobacter sp.]
MTSAKKILFRADAKPEIGIGDLMSLIQLSKYFEEDGWQAFFMIRAYEAGIRLIEKYEIKQVRIIESNITIPEEVNEINTYILTKSIDVVFFEITENKISDYLGLLSDVSKACVSFDGKILPDMKLVVDWDVAAHDYFSPDKYPETKFLLGPEYVILPYNFDLKRVAARRIHHPPKRMLIAMGGADEFDFTSQVIQELVNQKIQIAVTVVIGSGYKYRADLDAQLEESKLRYELKENISNMFEEYMRCDLAIGAGGLTASELVATGTPAYLIAIYEHQEARCKYFDENGWATYLGDFKTWKTNLPIRFDGIVKRIPVNFFKYRSIINICNEFTTK